MALYSRTKEWTVNEILTEPDLEGQLDLIINNTVPLMFEDYSDDLTQMRVQLDPYPSGVASLATTLAGELARIRYQIAKIIGQTYWYMDASSIGLHAANHGPNGSDPINALYRRPHTYSATEVNSASTTFVTAKTLYFAMDRNNLSDIKKVHAAIFHYGTSGNGVTSRLRVNSVTDDALTSATAYAYALLTVDVSAEADLTKHNIELEYKADVDGSVYNNWFDIWFE